MNKPTRISWAPCVLLEIEQPAARPRPLGVSCSLALELVLGTSHMFLGRSGRCVRAVQARHTPSGTAILDRVPLDRPIAKLFQKFFGSVKSYIGSSQSGAARLCFALTRGRCYHRRSVPGSSAHRFSSCCPFQWTCGAF